MTTYAVLIKNRTSSMNIDSLNRSAIIGSDLGNGSIFRLDTQSGSSGYDEVWDCTQVSANGSTLDRVWMAGSSEVGTVTVGSSDYRGLNPDPRNFYNDADKVFDAFKPSVGDVITLTATAISGSPSTGTYVIPTSGSWSMEWAASATSSALSLKQLSETYVTIGTGAIATERVLAYKLEVLAN